MVTTQISDFSLACIAALVLFQAIMLPRALFHLGHVTVSAITRRPVAVDPWLLAMAGAILVCGGLAAATALDTARAHGLIEASRAVSFAFLLFAAPAILQVLRAWANHRAKAAHPMSHALVALAILSMPASMAIPTAALLQSTLSAPAGQAAGVPPQAPADNPAAAVADARYFTDNEVANDPEDYPAAAYLAAKFSLVHTFQPHPGVRGVNFYRQVPNFTAFWFDQTADALSLEATDTFGLLVSRITYVRANWAFSLVVFLYKLLCGLVLVAISFDAFLGPLAQWLRRPGRTFDGQAPDYGSD